MVIFDEFLYEGKFFIVIHKETKTLTDTYMESEEKISPFHCPTGYDFWWRKSERS
jgi:hypothetical protein